MYANGETDFFLWLMFSLVKLALAIWMAVKERTGIPVMARTWALVAVAALIVSVAFGIQRNGVYAGPYEGITIDDVLGAGRIGLVGFCMSEAGDALLAVALFFTLADKEADHAVD